MITYNNLFYKIYSFENLLLAFKKARRNKTNRNEVIKYQMNLEENIIDLQNQLIWKEYEQSRYNEFRIYEPKERIILALPFKDRVLQHALINVIEPIYEKTFVHDSYACRANKGVIAAVLRLDDFQERHPKDSYFLKADIRKFFYSIDHATLKRIIRKKISCVDTLQLIDLIIDTTDDPGIPIGNLTSQLFANIYLNELDYFCKHMLKAKHYIRYMDDFIILSDDKNYLTKCFKEIEHFLGDRLKLSLNSKSYIEKTSKGIDFLGYRHWKNFRLLRKSNMKRNIKKFKMFMREHSKGLKSENEIKDSYQSFLGHLKWCNADSVKLKIETIIGELLCTD